MPEGAKVTSTAASSVGGGNRRPPSLLTHVDVAGVFRFWLKCFPFSGRLKLTRPFVPNDNQVKKTRFPKDGDI